jgi:hypothetical protein
VQKSNARPAHHTCRSSWSRPYEGENSYTGRAAERPATARSTGACERRRRPALLRNKVHLAVPRGGGTLPSTTVAPASFTYSTNLFSRPAMFDLVPYRTDHEIVVSGTGTRTTTARHEKGRDGRRKRRRKLIIAYCRQPARERSTFRSVPAPVRADMVRTPRRVPMPRRPAPRSRTPCAHGACAPPPRPRPPAPRSARLSGATATGWLVVGPPDRPRREVGPDGARSISSASRRGAARRTASSCRRTVGAVCRTRAARWAAAPP